MASLGCAAVSTAVADVIRIAESAFSGGQFQAEKFHGVICQLADAFVAGPSSVRLYVARLLERLRPFLGCTPFAVEASAAGHLAVLARLGLLALYGGCKLSNLPQPRTLVPDSSRWFGGV